MILSSLIRQIHLTTITYIPVHSLILYDFSSVFLYNFLKFSPLPIQTRMRNAYHNGLILLHLTLDIASTNASDRTPKFIS